MGDTAGAVFCHLRQNDGLRCGDGLPLRNYFAAGICLAGGKEKLQLLILCLLQRRTVYD